MAFEEAIRLAPTFLPSYVNAGLSLESLARFDGAVDLWLHVAQTEYPIDRDCIVHKVASLKHLARVFKNTGKLQCTEEALQQCLDLDPHQRDAIQHWIAVRQMQCKWPVVVPVGKLHSTNYHVSFFAALDGDPY